MKIANKIGPTKIIKRECAVCGKRIDITVYPSKRHYRGHYFGRLFISKDSKTAEYWACDDCFNE